MPIRLYCPRCGAAMKAADHLAGQRRNCPRCQHKVTVSANQTPPREQIQECSNLLEPAGHKTLSRLPVAVLGVVAFLLLASVLAFLLLRRPAVPEAVATAEDQKAKPAASKGRTGSSGPDQSPGQPETSPDVGRKYAVLVGVKAYDHSKLRPLDFTENDVVELRQVLAGSGYEVVLLCDREGQRDRQFKPTLGNIQRHLEAVLDRTRRHDTVLVGLAGHGLQFAGKDDSYFCPSDANPSAEKTQTLLSLSLLYQKLGDSGAGVKLLLVDACRDDPQQGRGRGVDADSAPRPPRGVAALFSCSAGERAFETDKYCHGVFFYHLLEGLRGQARNPDGEVTWDTLSGYVRTKVARDVPRTIGGGARQHPNAKADLSGESPVLVKVTDSGGKPGANPPDLGKTQVIAGKEFTNSIGMQLVPIKAGTFTMGSPKDQKGRSNDEEQHEVTLTKDFYLGKYLVTQEEYQAVMGKNPSRSSSGTRFPVDTMSWEEALQFCERLTEKEKGQGRGYRLPTEAEWEYACRAGSRTAYFFGDSTLELREYAWYADNSGGKSHEVGTRKQNAWGLYDMHGNVWQWCQDWYDKDYYPNSNKRDPQGPNDGTLRVRRGGSWDDNPWLCRAAYRNWGVPGRGNGSGFRVACVLRP